MRMKYFAVLIALFSFSGNTSAQTKYQDVEVTFGDFKSTNFNTLGVIQTEDGYLILRKKIVIGPGGHTYELENWGDDFKKVRSYDVTSCFSNDPEITFDRLLKVGNAYYMFTTRFFKEELKREVYFYAINEGTCAIGERNLLLSQKSEWRKNYSIVLSEDRANLLVTTFTDLENDEETELNFRIFDQNMEEVWTYNSVELANDYPFYSISNIALSNDARIYVCGYGGFVEDDTTIYDALYTIIDANNNSEQTVRLQLAEGRIVDRFSAETRFGDEGKVYVLGYFTRNLAYSISGIPYLSEGVFKLELNPEKAQVISQIYKDFDADIIPSKRAEYKLSKEQKRHEMFTGYSIDYIKPMRIFEHSDGSFSVIGIREYLTYEAMDGTQTITTPPDLIVSWIPEKGEVMNERHVRFGVSSIFQLGNTLCMPRRSRMSNVDCPGLTEKEKRKLKSGVELLEIMERNEKMRKEYYLDLENPGYDSPFTILWDQDVFTFSEDTYSDILVKTHYGKRIYGWVRIRFYC